jgi:hypothetical protein
MYHLPRELQNLIYEYDRTYRDVFDNCLFDIRHSLYVTYVITNKRIAKSKHVIEYYNIISIGIFNPSKLRSTCKHKVFLDAFYSKDYENFRDFYNWFSKNTMVSTKLIQK